MEPPRWRHLGQVEYTGAGRAQHVTSCFHCPVWSRTVRENPVEIAEAAWFPLDRLPAETHQGTVAITTLVRPHVASADD